MCTVFELKEWLNNFSDDAIVRVLMETGDSYNPYYMEDLDLNNPNHFFVFHDKFISKDVIALGEY